jgi:hypothetical protein
VTASDDELPSLSHEELVAEVLRLRDAIRRHRDASRHDLSWYQPGLWGLLPEQTDPLPEVPAWPEFLRGCISYRTSLDAQLPHAARVHVPYEGEAPPRG